MEELFASLSRRQSMMLLTAVTFGGQDALPVLGHLPDEEAAVLRHRAERMLEIPRERRIPLLVQEIKRLVTARKGHLWSAEPEALAKLLQGERPALRELILRALPVALADAVRLHLPATAVQVREELPPGVLGIVRWKLEGLLHQASAGTLWKFSDLLMLKPRELYTLVDRQGCRALATAIAALLGEEQAAFFQALPPEIASLAQRAVGAAAGRELAQSDARTLLAQHGADGSPLDGIRSAGIQRIARASLAQGADFAPRLMERHRPPFSTVFQKWMTDERTRAAAKGDGGRAEIVADLERLEARGLVEKPSRLPAMSRKPVVPPPAAQARARPPLPAPAPPPVVPRPPEASSGSMPVHERARDRSLTPPVPPPTAAWDAPPGTLDPRVASRALRSRPGAGTAPVVAPLPQRPVPQDGSAGAPRRTGGVPADAGWGSDDPAAARPLPSHVPAHERGGAEPPGESAAGLQGRSTSREVEGAGSRPLAPPARERAQQVPQSRAGAPFKSLGRPGAGAEEKGLPAQRPGVGPAARPSSQPGGDANEGAAWPRQPGGAGEDTGSGGTRDEGTANLRRPAAVPPARSSSRPGGDDNEGAVRGRQPAGAGSPQPGQPGRVGNDEPARPRQAGVAGKRPPGRPGRGGNDDGVPGRQAGMAGAPPGRRAREGNDDAARARQPGVAGERPAGRPGRAGNDDAALPRETGLAVERPPDVADGEEGGTARLRPPVAGPGARSTRLPGGGDGAAHARSSGPAPGAEEDGAARMRQPGGAPAARSPSQPGRNPKEAAARTGQPEGGAPAGGLLPSEKTATVGPPRARAGAEEEASSAPRSASAPVFGARPGREAVPRSRPVQPPVDDNDEATHAFRPPPRRPPAVDPDPANRASRHGPGSPVAEVLGRPPRPAPVPARLDPEGEDDERTVALRAPRREGAVDGGVGKPPALRAGDELPDTRPARLQPGRGLNAEEKTSAFSVERPTRPAAETAEADDATTAGFRAGGAEGRGARPGPEAEERTSTFSVERPTRPAAETAEADDATTAGFRAGGAEGRGARPGPEAEEKTAAFSVERPPRPGAGAAPAQDDDDEVTAVQARTAPPAGVGNDGTTGTFLPVRTPSPPAAPRLLSETGSNEVTSPVRRGGAAELPPPAAPEPSAADRPGRAEPPSPGAAEVRIAAHATAAPGASTGSTDPGAREEVPPEPTEELSVPGGARAGAGRQQGTAHLRADAPPRGPVVTRPPQRRRSDSRIRKAVEPPLAPLPPAPPAAGAAPRSPRVVGSSTRHKAAKGPGRGPGGGTG